MNTETRKAIAKIQSEISALVGTFEDFSQTLSDLRDSETEKFENLSEGLQESEMGQAIQSAADALDTAQSAIESARESMDECVDALATASE
jgi:uncharacterized phage infection (PIP) family protein YhgE